MASSQAIDIGNVLVISTILFAKQVYNDKVTIPFEIQFSISFWLLVMSGLRDLPDTYSMPISPGPQARGLIMRAYTYQANHKHACYK